MRYSARAAPARSPEASIGIIESLSVSSLTLQRANGANVVGSIKQT